MWAILREAEPEERLLLALVGAVAVGIPAWPIAALLLDNTLGPFPTDSPRPLAPLVVGLVGAVVGYGLGYGALWLSRTVALLTLVAYVVAGFVLFPTKVDSHESFVDTPNRRSECRGWQFSHYPPGVFDGTSRVYCVGLESRLPDG